MLYPIGIQDFPSIIRERYLYVDKTELILRLIRTGKTYFLSRPRRFGKSLLLSTMEAIFLGQEELFQDLFIGKSDYQWKSYPIVFLDFSLLATQSYEHLERSLQDQLQKIATYYGLTEIRKPTAPETLIELVTGLYHSIGPVVILIDEYDKPILDQIQDDGETQSFRNLFKKLFTNVKGLGRYLRFSFITGVTKFSQVSLFSGMNNLEDISFQHPYDALLGITEKEIDRYLGLEMQNLGIDRKLIKTWYNGYRFSGSVKSENVYNPLSLMSYLKSERLSNYWFATATPTFAFHLIRENNYKLIDFEKGILIGNAIEMNHEIDRIDLVTLLYQTGYLTISEYNEKTQRYRLHFPNEEVRRSFFEHLFTHLSSLREFETSEALAKLEFSLLEGNLEDFFSTINALLCAIPYVLHLSQEAYYHSLIYLLLKMLGYNVDAEVMTAAGRLDLVVRLAKKVFIFEFKINSSAEKALTQIKEQGYDKAFCLDCKLLLLIGVNIDTASRSINEWKIEQCE